jgi:hypothetical protein
MSRAQRTPAVSALERHDVAHLRAALATLAGTEDRPVDAKRIFDALHGQVGADERRAVVDELVLNASAAEAWRLARDLAPERPAGAVAGNRGPWWWMSMAAAVLLLVVGGGWRFLNPWELSDHAAYRSVNERTIASPLPQGADLPRSQPILRWSAVEGARYRVRVLTSDLDVLEETGELSSPEYRLSADVLRRIPTGSRILWQVQARVPGGVVVDSPTFIVRMK